MALRAIDGGADATGLRPWIKAVDGALRPEFQADVYFPARGEPILFGPVCQVAGCPRRGNSRPERAGDRYLCMTHGEDWIADGRRPLEAWLAGGVALCTAGKRRLRPCAAAGCERSHCCGWWCQCHRKRCGVTPWFGRVLVRVLCRPRRWRARTVTMKRTRHTSEQVIRKLRDAERVLAEHKSVAEIAKELGVSENTYHRWRNQFGGMKADDVKRLKELERENQRLKRIVANQALDIDGLKEIARGKLLSPARRRAAVAMLRDRLHFSERRACRLGQHRSTQRHEPPAAMAEDSDLRRELRDIARLSRDGATVARTAICARTARSSIASGCSGCGARKACGCRRRRASAGGWGILRPGVCAQIAPISCGRWTTSTTRPATGGCCGC